MTALDQLSTLADVLAIRTEQRRMLGEQIIGIAGAIGHVQAIDGDLVIHLRRAALSDGAKAAARELLDAGVIEADSADRLLLARMPSGEFECDLLRQTLGLDRRALNRRNAA